MDDFLGTVANLGFPIVVSTYLLVRIESKLEDLSKSILELSKVINTIYINKE